jgi:hypothetical protein
VVDLKTAPLHGVQERLCGMGQSKAQQWIHGLLVVLQATRRPRGAAPTRSMTKLAARLGVAEAEATALGVPTPEPPIPGAPPATAPAAPLWATMAPNGASSGPRLRLSRRAVIAARRHATRETTCC